MYDKGEMKSLERKTEPVLDSPMESSFPSFHVGGMQMPEIDSWATGGEYMLTVKVKMRHHSTDIDMHGKSSDARLDVLEYEPVVSS